jgi:HSP20 family molecular chaperone IbpA
MSWDAARQPETPRRGASLENGLLHIDLVREIPEAMRPGDPDHELQ